MLKNGSQENWRGNVSLKGGGDISPKVGGGGMILSFSPMVANIMLADSLLTPDRAR